DVTDNTFSLNISGQIRFVFPNDFKQSFLQAIDETYSLPVNDELFWLKVNVKSGIYEIPPRIDIVSVNTIPATHGETHTNYFFDSFSSSGNPDQEFKINEIPENPNLVKIEIRESDNKWRCWTKIDDITESVASDRHFVLNQDEKKIVFGNGVHGIIPPKGEKNINIYVFGGDKSSFIFSSNGLPHQRIELKYAPLLENSLKLEVREADSLWREWNVVDDLDASRPNARHIMLDLDQGIITFGDGIHGNIPPKGKNNIWIMEVRSGGGEDGNIAANTNMTLKDPSIYGVSVKNPKQASGGKNNEILNDAQKRVRKELKQNFRAITSDDIEDLVLSTPGIRVARAKALPNYHPQYPQLSMPGSITIVVVPYKLANSTQEAIPGNGFLNTITRHIKSRRLITSRFHVISPEFIKVNVNAAIRTDPRVNVSLIKSDVEEALRNFLSPSPNKYNKMGWPFGREVLISEIYEVIESFKGIDCVQSVSLSVESNGGCHRIVNGNIVIPKIGLVCANEILLNVT
ncbi:MAG: putative baseplate assembly protein, partial [Bacteroidales bacterium]|nr:putative baseplate assembly protein [Bacteroidales bacterium]